MVLAALFGGAHPQFALPPCKVRRVGPAPAGNHLVDEILALTTSEGFPAVDDVQGGQHQPARDKDLDRSHRQTDAPAQPKNTRLPRAR